MGDALVCIHCGLDRYPEAIPVAVAVATLQRRIIRETHPEYERYVELVREVRKKKEREDER